MAARISRIVVGVRITRIVVIAGVGRIDGDQGHVAKILAPLEANGFLAVSLGDDVIGKGVWYAVLVDGNQ